MIQINALQRENDIVSHNLKQAIIDNKQKMHLSKHKNNDNPAIDQLNQEIFTTEQSKNILPDILKKQEIEINAIEVFIPTRQPSLEKHINDAQTSFKTLNTITSNLKDKLNSLPSDQENKTNIDTMKHNIDTLREHHANLEHLQNNKDTISHNTLNALKIKKEALAKGTEFYKSVLNKNDNPSLKRKMIMPDSNTLDAKQQKTL
ncbi:hypothetical protein [Endozoicomonas sp.]|uniref:hypothetical protein n=1 Tax=Endozoicomonas sp. TaxID=1892382 RepID=UPI00383AECB6